MNMAASYSQRSPANHAEVITETQQVHKEIPKDKKDKVSGKQEWTPPSFMGWKREALKRVAVGHWTAPFRILLV